MQEDTDKQGKSNPASAAVPGATPPEPLSWPRPLRALLKLLAGVAALALLVSALLAGAVFTQPGSRLAWQLASQLVPGLAGEVVGGTLAHGLRLKRFEYRSAGQHIAVQELAGDWRLSWPGPRLLVSRLDLHMLDVRLLPTPEEPRKPPPAQLRLPLAFQLQRASVDVLHLQNVEQNLRFNGIVLSARSDQLHHEVHLEQAVTPWGALQARASIDGSSPVRLQADANLSGRVLAQPLAVRLHADGPLTRLPLQLRATSLQQQARLDALLTPWNQLPLESARLEASAIDPQVFLPAAPHARLDLQAHVAPVASAPSATPAPLSLEGRFSFTNASPRPADRQGLPLQSGQGHLRASAEQQQLTELLLRLPGGGVLQGQANAISGRATVELEARDVDLRQLASPLLSTRLSGPLRLQADSASQKLELDWQGKPMAVSLRASADQTRIEVQQARLRSGPSQMELSGHLERGDTEAYQANARLLNFDPARFVDLLKLAQGKGKATKLPAGIVLNAELSARGRLAPALSGDLNFNIHDSLVNQLPVTGQGELRWDGEQVRRSQVNLDAAGNRLRLEGSFGGKGDALRFNIDAPALGRLGLPLAGQIQAEGQLAGSLQQPSLQAQWQARALALGEQRLDHASGKLDLAGLPWRDADARMDASIAASGLRAAALALDDFDLKLKGNARNHSLQAQAQGRMQGQPLKLALQAEGAVDLQGAAPRWRGTLNQLRHDASPRILLQDPLAIDASAEAISLGRATLQIEQARLALERLQWRPERLSSAGQLSGLQPVQLLALQRRWTGEAPQVSGDLVLDGAWDVELDSSGGKGFLRLGRRSGDLQFGSPAGPIRAGVTELAASATLRGAQVQVDSRVVSERLGRVQADGSVGLQPQPGALALPGAASPLAIRVQAAVPDLARVSALAGPRAVLEGSLNADLRLRGSIEAPQAGGEVRGDRLALTLFDQGVRLDDGRLRARLDGEVLHLQELVFRGGEGSLRAQGQVALAGGNANLRTEIIAERLQLLADPARRLTLSGRALAINPTGQLQLDGKFTVDRARFSLPEKSAPTLDDDVVIVDRNGGDGSKTSSKQASRHQDGPPGLLPPKVALALDLGRDFRFEGAGANLRLAGTLNINSGPGQPPQATGTIRVAEGVYEAFGAKLEIERGVLTFQGPLDNPALNIRAMRRNQEVAAGVQVSGTAQRPRAELVSEPALSEEEKLSWLVFGRGTSNASGGAGQAQAALQGAALGLFNKFGSNKVGQGLGLNQLAIGSSQYTGLANQPVVTLGKEISNRLSIGYEQSLAGVGGVVRLTYELTRNWSVVLLGGTVAGLDLLYSKRYDRWGEPVVRRARPQTQ